MAQRGQSFQQILAHYFPGTSVRTETEIRGRGDAVKDSASPRRRVSASHFRLIYPESVDEREAEQVLSLLEANRSELLRRISAAGIQPAFPDLWAIRSEL